MGHPPSHPRRPGQCDRPHTSRAEKRLGNLKKVVSKVFYQYKQEVVWRNPALSHCSHRRELRGGVQSIYFRTGVTVIMARFAGGGWLAGPDGLGGAAPPRSPPARGGGGPSGQDAGSGRGGRTAATRGVQGRAPLGAAPGALAPTGADAGAYHWPRRSPAVAAGHAGAGGWSDGPWVVAASRAAVSVAPRAPSSGGVRGWCL
jgi:hypothetical protein